MGRIGQKETKIRHKQHAASVCITRASTRPRANEDLVGVRKKTRTSGTIFGATQHSLSKYRMRGNL
jgi:hypothetical protein